MLPSPLKFLLLLTLAPTLLAVIPARSQSHPHCTPSYGQSILLKDCTDALAILTTESASYDSPYNYRSPAVFTRRPTSSASTASSSGGRTTHLLPKGASSGTCALGIDLADPGPQKTIDSWHVIQFRLKNLIQKCAVELGQGGVAVVDGFEFVLANPANPSGVTKGTVMEPVAVLRMSLNTYVDARATVIEIVKKGEGGAGPSHRRREVMRVEGGGRESKGHVRQEGAVDAERGLLLLQQPRTGTRRSVDAER